MNNVLQQLATTRIVPVLVLDDPSPAADVGAALSAGGIPIVEVTFRRAGAELAIAALAADADLTVGAGTILTPDHVDRAVDAGAQFIVSPGLDELVLERADHHGVLALPGVATPTDIQRALRLHVSTMKLFPAGALGGTTMLSALAAPFPTVRFVPTGGIEASGLADYLRHPAVLAVGGSWLVQASWIRERGWDRITDAAVQARGIVDAVTR